MIKVGLTVPALRILKHTGICNIGLPICKLACLFTANMAITAMLYRMVGWLVYSKGTSAVNDFVLCYLPTVHPHGEVRQY